MIGLVVGLIVGYIISVTDKSVADYIRPFSQIFIRMIRMIIAPLLFGTLVAGIAGAGHFKDVGRMGLRAMIYFEVVTTVALLIGLLAVNIMQPGVGMVLPAPAGAPPITAVAQTWDQILLHMVPTSIIEAMASNEILQIVVFALVAGVAIARMGEKGEPLLALAESVSQLMLKMTGYVMLLAPAAVFAAVAVALAEQGVDIILHYASYVGGFYVALAGMWLLLMVSSSAILGPTLLKRLLIAIRQPALIGGRCASCSASCPPTARPWSSPSTCRQASPPALRPGSTS